MEHLMAVILAAGEGKRMKSKNSKVIHKILGKSLIEWVYTSALNAGIKESIIVVGHRADQIKECFGESVEYVLQEKQLGTGHAVMQAEKHFKDKDGYVFVLCGDTPLITAETISKTIKYHIENANSVTVITALLNDPSGYGRIKRNKDGSFLKIIEDRDTDNEEKSIREINSGIYCFNSRDLCEALALLDNNNNQGEYYITDTLGILVNKDKKVGAIIVEDSSEILGINDRVQLFEASEIMRKRILNSLLKSGVTIIDPASTYIDKEVKIGIDTIIYPGTILEGNTIIGEDCIIGPNSRIVSCRIGSKVEINNSIAIESSVGNNTNIGPFAYLRPESEIGKEVKIGDFVEIKKSIIGDFTKVSHLAYIGDAEIGKNVNLGCGVVVVNYNGKKKNKTVVGDNSFIGCNVNLISPVEVKNNAYVAAGSTITDEVPENSLAIARCRQVIKEDWVIKKEIKKEK